VQVTGLGAPQDRVHVLRGAPGYSWYVGAIRHEESVTGKLAGLRDARHSLLKSQLHKAPRNGRQCRAGQGDEALGSAEEGAFEDRLEVFGRPQTQSMCLQTGRFRSDRLALDRAEIAKALLAGVILVGISVTGTDAQVADARYPNRLYRRQNRTPARQQAAGARRGRRRVSAGSADPLHPAVTWAATWGGIVSPSASPDG
jgi:hypothetical protein